MSSIFTTNKVINALFANITVIAYGLLISIFAFQILTWPQGSLYLITNFGLFFFLGLGGALVANSTGAGGGVIFIPFFSALSMSASEAIATSIAIQCFGMTAGSISWLKYIELQGKIDQIDLSHVKKILIPATVSTSAGILFAQYGLTTSPADMELTFGIFSIIFGIILCVFTLIKGKQYQGKIRQPKSIEIIAIIITCFLGGIITAWISVGVGEAVALLLFFLGYPAFFAVSVGVVTSSIAVLTAVNFHILANDISIEVLLFAGMAAFIGGYFARYITKKIGAYNLKIFFAMWILLSGLVTLY